MKAAAHPEGQTTAWWLITLPIWIAPALVLVFVAAVGFGIVLGVAVTLDAIDTVRRARAATIASRRP